MSDACCPHCEEQYRELLERRESRIAKLEAENARLREWQELAFGMLSALRMGFIPGAFKDTEGHIAIVQLIAERDTLKAENVRLRAFAESASETFTNGQCSWCSSCGARSYDPCPSTIKHYRGCLYVRAQAALKEPE